MANEFFLKSKLNGNVIDIRGGNRNNGAGLISGPRKVTIQVFRTAG